MSDNTQFEKDRAFLQGLEEQEREKRNFLRKALDDLKRRDGKVIALRAEMGVTLHETGTVVSIPYYTVVHTLSYLGNKAHIKLGSEMPFMDKQRDQKGRLVVSQNNAPYIAQRAPDYTRQISLTSYLLQAKERKFGTILVVVSPPWVHDPNHENWVDGRATKDAINFEALDSEGSIGLIEIDGVPRFALDGQHRIMGLRGLVDLDNSELRPRDKAGNEKKVKNWPDKDKFLAEHGIERRDLANIMIESTSVEYVPAVMKGETEEEAVRRIRSVFVAINSKAKKTKDSEESVMDEHNGTSIAARNIALTHELFKGGSRVNWEDNNLPRRRGHITTLRAIKDSVGHLIKNRYPDTFGKVWPPLYNAIAVRPTDEAISQVVGDMGQIFDGILNLPSIQKIANFRINEEIDFPREFPKDENETGTGRGHLLLRPIGLSLVVDAITQLTETHSLEHIFDKLTRFDIQGGWEQHNKKNIWYKVTYKDGKMVMGNLELAAKLLMHLIVGTYASEQDGLLEKVKKVRSDETGSNWLNFEGKMVPMNDRASGLPLQIG